MSKTKAIPASELTTILTKPFVFKFSIQLSKNIKMKPITNDKIMFKISI